MLRKGGMTRVLRHATVKGARLRVLLALAGVEDAQGVTTTTRALLWARAEVPWWAGWWLLRDLERRGMLAVGRAQACGRYAVLVGLTADEVQAVRARLDARSLG